MATKKTTKVVPTSTLTKTGEVRFRDEDGVLWLSESFVNEAGEVSTQSMPLSEDDAAS